MEKIGTIVNHWHLHPFVDHFTISLLIVALLADIAASLLPLRLWLRYAALALMITGAVAAAASWFTGGFDAHQTSKLLPSQARAILHDHARLGYYLMIAFAVLALWRLLIQLLAFMQRTRQIYLALTLLAVIFLLYQGYLGGQLVYEYGAGTEVLLRQAPAAAATVSAGTGAPGAAAPSAAPSSLPTVYVPTAAPSAAATETAPAEPSAEPTATAGTSDAH